MLVYQHFLVLHIIDFRSLPKDKISGKSKLKDFADEKIYVTKKLNFIFGKVGNIVGKGENAGNQHLKIVLKILLLRVITSPDCVVKR